MKDLKISKELFEAVYNCDITTDKDMLGVYKSINLYEFAFKCKDWACSKGFILISYKQPYEAVKKKGYCQTHHIHDKTRGKDKPFVCDFEYEAIIKACEWILSEVNK